MPMRRADRSTPNDDNARNHPRSRQPEPASRRELEQSLMTVRSQRDEWQQKAREFEGAANQLVHVQQELQLSQTSVQEWQSRAEQNYQLLLTEREQVQSYIALYTEEKTKAGELLVKYEQAKAQTQHYIILYEQAQSDLAFERRSKAGIKGWETRRKRENERLKQEIAEMTMLLKESLERKEEAVNSLYEVANRMDRIQKLVESVETESTDHPVGLLQKFKRIWQAIRDILEE